MRAAEVSENAASSILDGLVTKALTRSEPARTTRSTQPKINVAMTRSAAIVCAMYFKARTAIFPNLCCAACRISPKTKAVCGGKIIPEEKDPSHQNLTPIPKKPPANSEGLSEIVREANLRDRWSRRLCCLLPASHRLSSRRGAYPADRGNA